MTTESREGGGGSGLLFAFLAGAAIGAATALLFAPARGTETRARLRRTTRDMADKARHGVENLKGTVGDLKDTAGESWQRAVDAAKDAFDAALQRD